MSTLDRREFGSKGVGIEGEIRDDHCKDDRGLEAGVRAGETYVGVNSSFSIENGSMSR
jgi:hypothetical protein